MHETKGPEPHSHELFTTLKASAQWYRLEAGNKANPTASILDPWMSALAKAVLRQKAFYERQKKRQAQAACANNSRSAMDPRGVLLRPPPLWGTRCPLCAPWLSCVVQFLRWKDDPHRAYYLEHKARDPLARRQKRCTRLPGSFWHLEIRPWRCVLATFIGSRKLRVGSLLCKDRPSRNPRARILLFEDKLPGSTMTNWKFLILKTIWAHIWRYI